MKKKILYWAIVSLFCVVVGSALSSPRTGKQQESVVASPSPTPSISPSPSALPSPDYEYIWQACLKGGKLAIKKSGSLNAEEGKRIQMISKLRERSVAELHELADMVTMSKYKLEKGFTVLEAETKCEEAHLVSLWELLKVMEESN